MGAAGTRHERRKSLDEVVSGFGFEGEGLQLPAGSFPWSMEPRRGCHDRLGKQPWLHGDLRPTDRLHQADERTTTAGQVGGGLSRLHSFPEEAREDFSLQRSALLIL